MNRGTSFQAVLLADSGLRYAEQKDTIEKYQMFNATEHLPSCDDQRPISGTYFLAERAAQMKQNKYRHTGDDWQGWSTITAGQTACFTLWFTGLHGTGKTTLARLVQKALVARGHKVEIIDTESLSRWLKQELHIEENMCEDRNTIGPARSYDAFVTYICTLLAHNGIITIASSVSPYREARVHAREHIPHFL